MKNKKQKIKIILTRGIRVVVIRNKHREERRRRVKPYYSNFSLYDMKGEPLVERDFEG